ncbi:MFS transporter [Acidicapsa acidisoli]|uniref:MFS transporter n=1 Tax=Acidicapsa acidisoli TaxID=1615681 RepID=UPI0021E0ECB3|nr:MFS transporter [Acidicapsa acidisoli]
MNTQTRTSSASLARRLVAGFTPPALPPCSRRALRFHLAFTILYAVFEGITANAPVMAVESMNATDVQLQMPLAMASGGLFLSVLMGSVMARRPKKPFVLAPGFTAAVAAIVMACMPTAGWFLFMLGIVSICDFAMRPAVPSIMRIVYPVNCRSHVSGTMRQYGSVAFLAATLLSSALLSTASVLSVRTLIRIEIGFGGIVCAAAFLCFRMLPDHGDGSGAEADAVDDPQTPPLQAALSPLRDKWFLYYLLCIFVYSFSNLFYQGVIPAFFARDLHFGYLQTALLIHIIPSIAAFFCGGFLSTWFERTSIWRSFSLVALLWGLDPVIVAAAPYSWPMLILARCLRGPATLGSMVISFFTGVHSFARPGGNTSRYMAAQFMVNGVARLSAPLVAAFALAYLSRRSIIFYGGLGILGASALFLAPDKRSTVCADSHRDELPVEVA